MKKIYLALLCASGLMLAACGGSQKTDSPENKTENTEGQAEETAVAEGQENADEATATGEKAKLDLKVEESIPADLKDVYAKGDFQPCMAVFFKDDLAGEKTGEFPSKWDIANGSAEVATFDGRTVIKLDNNDAQIVPQVAGASKNYLPEVFTFECDYYCNGDAEEDFNANYHFYLNDDNGGRMSEIVLSTENRLVWYLLKINDETVDGESDKLPGFEQKNSWNHFSFSFDKGTLKVYVNGQRLVSLPNIKAPGSISIAGESWDDHRYCFGNVRMATVAPKE